MPAALAKSRDGIRVVTHWLAWTCERNVPRTWRCPVGNDLSSSVLLCSLCFLLFHPMPGTHAGCSTNPQSHEALFNRFVPPGESKSAKGTFYLSGCFGLPRGRRDDSSPRSAAVFVCQRVSPNGVPRVRLWWSDLSSASVSTPLTRRVH